MTKELVISANRHETKLAILEDEQLVEIYFQSADEYSLVGSIHKGRVTRVLPGMQSAFVDIGLERDAFLYVSDFFEEGGEDYERVTPAGEDRGRRNEPRGPRPEQRSEPRPEARPEQRAEPRTAQPPPQTVSASPESTQQAPAADGSPRDRNGDRGAPGRRSRRRRGRGRGFPDSKYASPDASDSTDSPAEAQQGPAVQEEASFDSPAEAFVLPGESIAKYAATSTESGADSQADPQRAVPETPDQPSAAAPGRASFWGRFLKSEPERASAPVVEIHGIPLQESLPSLDPEIVDEIADALADEAAIAAANTEKIADARQREAENAIAAQDASNGDAAAMEDAQPGDEDGATEQEDDDSGVESPSVEETAAGPSGDAAAEPGPAPLGAEVRDQQQARYINRGSRRPRRRGGRGGDRGDRPQGGDRGAEPRTEAVPESRPEPAVVTRPDRERAPMPSISDLLKEGQEILVQIAKEPLGTKGARITSHIAMPGRYVVYMPTLDHLGVSRKISTDEERQRLKRIITGHAAGMTGGFIVRTAGEGMSDADIGADMSFLYNQWLDIRKKAEKRPAPLLLHHDLELVTRTLRDQVNEQFKAIWVDNEELFEGILRFLERFQPALVNRVKMYTRPVPIFETFNITAELEKALRPKVWLKSGGYIVINQTEALVAIDINTGKYVGKSNRLEDTIVKTNIEAIKEIVRQVRLRDLGGIIVVDFIDMDERRNRHRVMQALEEAMRVDRAPYKILQFNDFGLVAITRRRVKQSLERALCSPCPTCEGAGYVKSVQTVIGEILTEGHKIAPALEGKDVMLRVNPEVAKALKAQGGNYMEELEEILGRPVIVKSDHQLHPEKFDLA
ncbi:MAG: Rne/Rng family ribonuclease [Acidobacteriia bacterium]|nr:Rne/Rng family ribonuclease [Terriglobia bacterium]